MKGALELEKVRQDLEEQRAALLSRTRLKYVQPGVKKSNNVSANLDRADLAQDYFAKERNTALMERMQGTLEQVEAALERIDDGTFGKCLNCGNNISPARLQALPYAELCIECQEQQESN